MQSKLQSLKECYLFELGIFHSSLYLIIGTRLHLHLHISDTKYLRNQLRIGPALTGLHSSHQGKLISYHIHRALMNFYFLTNTPRLPQFMFFLHKQRSAYIHNIQTHPSQNCKSQINILHNYSHFLTLRAYIIKIQLLWQLQSHNPSHNISLHFTFKHLVD